MKCVILILLISITTTVFAQRDTAVNPITKVGDTVTISGRIIAGSWLIHVKTKPTFLNLWDSVPNHRLMIRIEPEDRAKFREAPEKYYLNKTVVVKGVVNNYKGTALIKISDTTMLKMNELEKKDTLAFGNKIVQKLSPSAQLNIYTTTDSALQSKWINKVTNQSFQKSISEIRFVQKEIPLRVSPTKESPVIADLQPGIAVSILSKSRKWSYITVKNPDGTSSVFGFIKNRELKHIKKQKAE